MTSTRYNWRASAVVRGNVDAQAAGEELARIQREHGFCTPEVLIEESRPEGAPLHDAFTWNDQEAAELYRKHEARTIIRAIEVEYPDSPAPEPMLTLVRVEVPVEGHGVKTMSQYRITRDVVSNPEMFQQALESARGYAAAAISSLDRLEQIAHRQNHPKAQAYRKTREQMKELVGGLR